MRSILVLFVCFVGCLSNPVPEQEKTYAIVSNYTARVDTYTSANPDVVARWTVSGTLSQIWHSRYVTVLQLRDIKSSIYNGPRDKFIDAEHVIPEEGKILEQPFALRIGDDDSLTLLVKKNEPKWSINMKKGIMNMLNFEYEIPRRLPNGTLQFYTPSEKSYRKNTLYGDCYVTCKRTLETRDELRYEYTLDGSNCTRNPIDSTIFTNIKGPSMRDKLDYTNKKIITVINGNGNRSTIERTIVSKTRISYQSCPSCAHTQQVDQQQSLTFVNDYYPDEVADISEYTETKDATFEPETTRDFTSGRFNNKVTSSDSDIAEQFINLYYNLQNKALNYSLPKVYTVEEEDLVETMFTLLINTDLKGLKSIEETLRNFQNHDKNEDIGYFFFSLLSYVGTNATTEYIIKFLQQEDVEGTNYATRIMLTFPRYIFHYSDDKLIEYEALTKTAHIVANKKMNKSALLGFSCAIGLACQKKGISKKLKQQYIDMFNQKFLQAETYETRMTNLLGLVNMGKCLDFDFMTAITTNSSESNQLRLLALTGFKEYLRNSNQEDKLFSTYWPMVQKRSEPFEVRIAALDVLLNDDVLGEQFTTIAGKYSGELEEAGDRQIANYILTHLHSGKLGLHGDHKTIKSFNLHRYPKSFATGLYNFQYQDSEANVGSYLKSQVITEPKNNMINFVQVSLNSFALGYDFGTYSVYINLHGLCDESFLNRFFKTNTDPSLSELINLLKEYKLNVETRSQQAHVDIVVFVDNVAVYAQHLQTLDMDVFRLLAIDVEDMLQTLKHIQFPVVNMLQMPSDLGTLISVTASVENMAKYNDKKQFRNSWTHEIWMEVYNPILNTHVATFKYDNVELYAHLNFTVESKVPTKVSWYNSKDGLGVTWASSLGSAIDQRHCRECEPFYASLPSSLTKYTTELSGLRKIILGLLETDENHNIFKGIEDIYGNNKLLINSDANPYAYPVLFSANLIHYKFGAANSISSGSISVPPSTTEDDVTKSTLLLSPYGNDRNGFDLPQRTDIKVNYEVENLNGELLYGFNTSTNIYWSPNYAKEDTNPKQVVRMVYFYMEHKGINNSSNFRVCGYGERLFPNRTSDRLSLQQYEPVNSKISFYLLKNPEPLDLSSDEDCNDASASLIFTEQYTPIEKEIILQNEQSLRDYKQCVTDSTDLKFTSPSEACKRISSQLTEYGNYKLYVELIKHEGNVNVTTSKPLLEYTRNGVDMLDIKLLREGEKSAFTKSLYYPRSLPNPLRLAYSMDDTAVSFSARSICSITPIKVQQFSGNLVTNDKKKWLAFAECYNTTHRALHGRTIDDKHVGFTFYSNDKVLEGTVKDGKAHVTYNGQPVTEYLYTDDFKLVVHLLDDDVIYVRDVVANAELYYNTEYIAVRIESLYSNVLCGICSATQQ